MTKIKSSLFNMVAVLTIITALVGAILGGVFTLTEQPIADAKAKAQEEAIRQVTPEFNNNPANEKFTVTVNGTDAVIYPALKDGKMVGAAIETSTRNGFSGEIVVMVGFDSTGTIHGYQVLSHAETPGLGAKMDEWFRTNKGNQSIIGKHPGTNNLTVSKDGGEVDAITASTITSRAFLEVINTAHQAFTTAYDNNTTPTTPNQEEIQQ